MYIRTTEEALDAVAEILELSQRRDQIVQSTVQIMLCLEAGPRAFLTDCQALLVEGGLEALRERRRALLESLENVPVVVLDPEEDRLFEAAARALDALRFAGVVFQVFPEFGMIFERWWAARAILAREEEVRRLLTAAIRARRYAEEFDPVRRELQAVIIGQRPEWIHRFEDLRSACREALRRVEGIPTDRWAREAEDTLEVLATSDDRVNEILKARDPAAAEARIRQIHDLVAAVRSVAPRSAARPGEPDLSQVA